MPQIITNTAELSCNQGTATSKLNVTSQDFVTIEGKAMATEEDKQANSNIQLFKQCKLKPSSGGYLSCVPAPIKWEDTAEKDTIMGFYRNNDFNTAFRPESPAVIENFKNEYRNVTIDRNGTPYRYFVPKLMRKILLYIVVLTINHMMAQENKNSLKDTIMFEKFDFNLWNTRYKDFEKDPKYGDHYKLKDGSSFRPMYGGKGYIFYDVIPPLPAYYHYFYDYYENGNLKAYGKYAGMQVVKIGVWHYFDENGKETQVDEEAKLGKWTFNAILEVLHKDGVIDLYTGKNRDWNKLYIEFKNNNRKVAVIVFKERIDILIDTYYKYIFNCKTGKYTRKEYERYNENAKDMPTLPPLKNSKKNKRKRKNSISISEEEYQDLQILQCKTINNNNKAECLNDRVMFEYFDFELHNRNYEGYDKEIGNPHFYKAKDGNLFKGVNFGGENIYYIVIPKKPAYYRYMYYYYPNGKLRKYGKYAGMGGNTMIGTWCYYDENGKLEQIDEERKFGKWSFEKILGILNNDSSINLETGKNREADKLYFEFDKIKHIWIVTVVKKVLHDIIDVYYEYIFDCTSGKYVRKEYERYNNAAGGFELPPLKNSKEQQENSTSFFIEETTPPKELGVPYKQGGYYPPSTY